MAEETTQPAEVTQQVKGNLVVSFNQPTPKWATIVFRAVFLLTTAISLWISGTNLVQEGSKVEVMLALKCLDVMVWGAAQSLGIKPPENKQL